MRNTLKEPKKKKVTGISSDELTLAEFENGHTVHVSNIWRKLIETFIVLNEMVLTIMMKGLPRYARLLLSSTPCIVSLAARAHLHNHRIIFHRLE